MFRALLAKIWALPWFEINFFKPIFRIYLSIYLSKCVCVCVCVCTRVIHTDIYECVCITFAHTDTHTHTFIYIYKYIYVDAWVCITAPRAKWRQEKENFSKPCFFRSIDRSIDRRLKYVLLFAVVTIER